MLGKCACCEVYKEQVKHLQALLDQTLALIAPKTAEPKNEEEESPQEGVMRFGEG